MRIHPSRRTGISEDRLEFLKRDSDVPPIDSNRHLLDAWHAGDQSAAAILFDRYVARLTALVRARLSRKLARRVDAEDVVLSAFRSFFVAAGDGRVAVPESDDLWPLLVVLSLRKLASQAERHQAQQQSLHRETHAGSQLLAAAISANLLRRSRRVKRRAKFSLTFRTRPGDRHAAAAGTASGQHRRRTRLHRSHRPPCDGSGPPTNRRPRRYRPCSDFHARSADDGIRACTDRGMAEFPTSASSSLISGW